MKICSKCKISKEKILFYKDCHKIDGLSPCCKSCKNKQNDEYFEKNKEYITKVKKNYVSKLSYRKKGLKRNYNMTLDDYDKMFYEQGGKCEICNTSFSVLCVDHNHETGTIRGLLCKVCNAALGFAKENITTLNNMIDYLNKYKE